jgi:hypothetical protein
MLKNNIYNIDKEFDYTTVKDIVVKSLEKIVKQEALKNKSNIPMMSYLIMEVLMTTPIMSNCLPRLVIY